MPWWFVDDLWMGVKEQQIEKKWIAEGGLPVEE